MSGRQIVFTLLAVAAMWTATSCYRHWLKCELEIRRAELEARKLEAAARLLGKRDADYRAAIQEAIGKSGARAIFESDAQK